MYGYCRELVLNNVLKFADFLVSLKFFLEWEACHRLLTLIRQYHSSASNFACSYSFLSSMVCHLSVVCHIYAPFLNCSMDLHAIWQVHLHGPMTHCQLGSVTPGERGIWGARSFTYLLMIYQGVAPRQNLHLPTWFTSDQRFHLLQNYFWLVYFCTVLTVNQCWRLLQPFILLLSTPWKYCIG